jgi:sulfur relay (sulfurtransferase) complex TusBCD TusD component (DsrE family)
MDARGLRVDDVVAGAQRSTLTDLANRTADSDKVLVF